jgi:hypothetical protein
MLRTIQRLTRIIIRRALSVQHKVQVQQLYRFRAPLEIFNRYWKPEIFNRSPSHKYSIWLWSARRSTQQVMGVTADSTNGSCRSQILLQQGPKTSVVYGLWCKSSRSEVPAKIIRLILQIPNYFNNGRSQKTSTADGSQRKFKQRRAIPRSFYILCTHNRPALRR